MATYGETVRVLQPLIGPIFTALESGLEASEEHHARRNFLRSADPHYFTHTARRVACDKLREQGIQAEDERGRPAMRLSGLLVLYKGLAVKVLRANQNSAGDVIVPLPGQSRSRQRFWRQDAGGALPGLETDNVLLLWQDKGGVLADPMWLARPLGGDYRRSSLRLDWEGPLARRMMTLREADLDELEPKRDYRRLGDEGAG